MKTFIGNAVSRGYALGKVYVFCNPEITVPETVITEDMIEDEIKVYETSRETAEKTILEIRKRIPEDEKEKAGIMDAHLAILKDRALDKEVRNGIRKRMRNAEYAVSKAFDKFAGMMAALKDERMRERAQDFLDLKQRVLYAARGRERRDLSILPENCIVVCHELFPSDTANIDREHVQAILTEIGGETSHSAILARTYEIPAILGIDGLLQIVQDGELLAVDAMKGTVIVEPDQQVEEEYKVKIQKFRNSMKVLNQYRSVVPCLKDGERVEVMLNLGSVKDAELSNAQYVDGVGLLRSEFLYMESNHMPDEEEQFRAYKKAVTAFGKKPLILRTLDIGGDKNLSYFEMKKEDNPFLGLRAIRLCFAYPEILHTQLRAALRASAFGNLWIMFPMIGSVEDFRRAKNMVEEVKKELQEEEKPYNPDIMLGAMIEIPSLAILADRVAKEVDFASVGSNDLVQYTMAADRGNSSVSEYYQNYNPAVFQLLKNCADGFMKADKPLCICGEMGGDPLAEMVLIGFGFRRMSMSFSSIAEAKKLIVSLSSEQAAEIAASVCEMDTQQEIRMYLETKYADIKQKQVCK